MGPLELNQSLLNFLWAVDPFLNLVKALDLPYKNGPTTPLEPSHAAQEKHPFITL